MYSDIVLCLHLQIQKFERCSGLRDILLGTGDRLIAEASPTDRIWGIGKCRSLCFCALGTFASASSSLLPKPQTKLPLLSGMRESDPATARPADWRGSNILASSLCFCAFGTFASASSSLPSKKLLHQRVMH